MFDLLSGLDPLLLIELIVSGFLVGVIASMVGIGGGLLVVPMLILIFAQDAQIASAISIVVIILPFAFAKATLKA